MALLFMGEDESYSATWPTPFSPWVHYLLYEATPWKIRPIDHLFAVCLILASRSRDGKGPSVLPMRNALRLAAATLVIWYVYGVVLRGGVANEAGFQTYLPLSGILMTFTFASAFRTPEHFATLAKPLLVAATYRAVMCWTYYIFHVQDLPPKLKPEFMTSHDDTVLWVGCMIFLIVRAIWAPSMAARAKVIPLLLFFLVALVFNSRRLAWVSLSMAFVLMFILMPPGKYKRRINRALLPLAPILAIYIVLGSQYPKNPIFKPVGGIFTVSSQDDDSTKARNMENLGIIRTSNYSSLLMGTGWGHGYIEVSHKYYIGGFYKQWAYFPHNSILSMLGFTGVLGFFGYWLPFPIAMYLNARTARKAQSPVARQAGIVGAVLLIVCANQWFGDMGIRFVKAVYILSLGYALALRLPILVGAWPEPKGSPRAEATLPRPVPVQA
jgi:hypothetical protein